MAPFSFPAVHNFPPLYTIQPVEETRKEQMETWGEILVGYHGNKRVFQQTVAEAAASPVFKNDKINRRLSVEEITQVIDALVEEGRARWMDETKTKFAVLWKSISDWADSIWQWVTSSGHTDSVMTFFELLEGDDTVTADFYGMDRDIFELAISELEGRGKANVFVAAGEKGVKFGS
uniref:ESCRT-II complex subunit VPS25 n=1 Tax=Palpitomonas bilix TaxID=652834 RepID=A0A7S3GJ86_9EUKA|mmetsp:Transcript_592/g.1237  ORF Transcript_592/g.1237 Transcript_592/m.1237 type:complete len:177 (+) Transcript_592:184-714(+)|eukprot:CAMPEP_0113881610 /NCGR_PEP_ID=MMETSP0780_2-20120614/8473_1 /TAXON_ID=652834 /ORGANISM="Palpitomonas bilix" /LENGTH=176 /DNA_ID=CAMNT_0000868489 /DNA_START=188 /DNA_END=718 /DNA_ORIENTATION=- /assembly_acc=CAM_ASM_000599